MAYEFIDREECIGDSLFKINNNSVNFDSRINTLNTNLNTNIQSLSGQVFKQGSILTAHFHSFSDSTTRSGDLRNYGSVNNGTLPVISTRSNSRFLITVNGQGYVAPGGTGTNIGINRTVGSGTARLLGRDGNDGDSWMGTSNGHYGAFSITRTFLDVPVQPAGTTILYSMLHGHWSAGTSYINYQGYVGQSSIVVYEII